MAALLLKTGALRFRLDPFGGDPHAESRRKFHDRTDDSEIRLLMRQVANKTLVDFELVERTATQIAQAGIAGSEVVERKSNLHRSERRQHGASRRRRFEKDRFRNFQLQTLSRQSAVAQRAAHDRRNV